MYKQLDEQALARYCSQKDRMAEDELYRRYAVRLDVYLGGGLEADYCLGATLAGERIAKDGFGLSLLGAGGIQLNLTKQIGLYVEPEISWTIPSESHVLQTYRSDNPVMFSLTSGLRFNIGK